ncbi:MAG: hypothetical protein BWY83_00508 [bacterium ADurb.Bin478]|nr:MAG: hypothetical protein BWY83_00508 [bacterium ADurb.Bin478]
MKIGLLPFYLELYDQVCPQYHDPAQRFADCIVEELRKRGFEVVSSPLCRVRSEFRAALETIENAGCEALATLHLAYSPSLESADLVAASPLPVVVLDTTPDAVFVQQASDDRVNGSFNDLKHAAFRATFAVLAHDAHADLILVQDRTHLVRRQVDVGAAVFSNQKPMPVAVALHRTFNFIQQTAGGVDILDI